MLRALHFPSNDYGRVIKPALASTPPYVGQLELALHVTADGARFSGSELPTRFGSVTDAYTPVGPCSPARAGNGVYGATEGCKHTNKQVNQANQPSQTGTEASQAKHADPIRFRFRFGFARPLSRANTECLVRVTGSDVLWSMLSTARVCCCGHDRTSYC